ncbi:hypothetical protein Tco_0341980, partial [Tanacetum coccineum]
MHSLSTDIHHDQWIRIFKKRNKKKAKSNKSKWKGQSQ